MAHALKPSRGACPNSLKVRCIYSEMSADSD